MRIVEIYCETIDVATQTGQPLERQHMALDEVKVAIKLVYIPIL